MSSSFIEFRKNGYWIADGFNEIIARYIVETIDSLQNKPNWLFKMRDKIYNISQGHYIGWNNFGFDDFLDDDIKIHYFIEVLDKTELTLKTKGKVLTTQELNSYDVPKPFKSEWTRNIETSEIVNLLQNIKSLLVTSK